MAASLVQLETFVRLAAVGNFTRVAAEFHLTQPGVTQQVRALERHYGVTLVDLIGRRPELTDAGRFLALRAREVLGSVAALEREMGEFAAARGGDLSIGATLTVGNYVLPSLLAHYTAAHPGIHIEVQIANTTDVARLLRNGEISVALIEGAIDDAALQVDPFQQDELCLVTAPSHPFARRGAVRVRDLAGERFVSREHGSGTRAIVESALKTAGVTPAIVLELPSGEGIARAVEAELGIAILSRHVVAQAVAVGRLALIAIEDLRLVRTLQVATARARTLSPAAEAFTALVKAL